MFRRPGEEKADFRVADLRESINLGDERDEAFPNPWPAELPDFKTTMLELFDASDALQLDVLRCLALGMGLGEELFRVAKVGWPSAQ